MELMDKLWNAAKENKQRIVLPEGDEERTIVATEKNSKRRLSISNFNRRWRKNTKTKLKSLMLI